MDSRSAPESEDSSLPSKSRSRNTAVSQPSKTTRKQLAGSGSVSRKRRSSPMLWDSMEDPSVIEWIASLPVSPASRIPSPASEKEPATNDGSGPTSPESSEKPSQELPLLKTLRDCCAMPAAILRGTWKSPQTTLLGEWEKFSGIWPQWGLCLSGEVYELPRWEPATAAPESSFWPITRAEDSESTGAHRGNSDTLTNATELWSTPNQDEQKRGPGFTLTDHHYGPHDLTTEAEMWRTPHAPKAGGSRTHTSSSADGHQFTIADQAEMWQTPATDSFRSRGGDPKEEMGLDQQARFWASPRARDFRSGETIQQYGNSRPLSEQVIAFSLPAPTTQFGLTFWQRVRILLPLCRRLRRRLPSPYNKARSIFKRKLNPNFVDWLMGWPVGWSSADRAFSAEEMALYLYRQQQCLRFLLNE